VLAVVSGRERVFLRVDRVIAYRELMTVMNLLRGAE
jgi:biopolymer transport protein ExbD